MYVLNAETISLISLEIKLLKIKYTRFLAFVTTAAVCSEQFSYSYQLKCLVDLYCIRGR